MKNKCGHIVRGLLPLIVLCVLIRSHWAFAQETSSSTLDEILSHLESNLHYYIAQIPSFFCSEHVISLMIDPQGRKSTVTDSIFRLKRVFNADNSTALAETREIVSINGTPARGTQLHGPAVLSRVFSRGLDAVSLGQTECMRYTLQSLPSETKDHVYIIAFATHHDNQTSSDCVLSEEGFGRVFIDPGTFQVSRMELTVPHHLIAPPTYIGVWKIAIDYRPVQLDKQTFWLPWTITSTLSPKDDDQLKWTFEAQYTSYHKLEVSSRILPFDPPKLP
jgi:hypothetical protein